MKHTIQINQKAIAESGLLRETDLIDWVLLDYLRDWYFVGYGEGMRYIDPVYKELTAYVYIDFEHVIQNMPILGIKSKGGLSKRISKLASLGLLLYQKDKLNRMYFMLTPSMSVMGFSDSGITIPGEPPEQDKDEDTEVHSDIYMSARRVFDHWNSKDIIRHRSFRQHERHIVARLSEYTERELKEAIDNYATVLKGKEYWWTYRWGLDEFLVRKGGLDKFLTENEPLKNFKGPAPGKKLEPPVTPPPLQDAREIMRRRGLL